MAWTPTRKISTDRDLSGQKFNYLTAIDKFWKDCRWFWNCKCDCGNTVPVRQNYLLNGRSSSCGCQGSRATIGKRREKPDGQSSARDQYNLYRNSAEVRGYEFLLTQEELRAITIQHCHYCGEPPRPFGNERKKAVCKYFANGIDRKTNTIGYTVDNCVPCCITCNRAKFQMTEIQFKDWILKAATHLQGL